MECVSGCREVGVGGQQHEVELAENKTRGTLASSEPFIYIERRRSKEQNKCQACRCADKLKLEEEKKKSAISFQPLPHLSNLCDVTFIPRRTAGRQSHLERAVDVYTAWHDSAATPNQCQSALIIGAPKLY